MIKHIPRTIFEDALKHLHQSERSGRPATLESVAGFLGLDRETAVQVLDALHAEGLAVPKEGAYRLAARGREIAVRLVRAHRLYETWLSEHTGHPETDWHREADIREHQLTREEIDGLARALGHPRYDPHGDPIPTAAGSIPPRRGRPLGDWPVGPAARVVHVEDEPASVYAQIAAFDIYPGTNLRVLARTSSKTVIESAGRTFELAPSQAANISVLAASGEVDTASHRVLLSALSEGEQARVKGILPRCRGPERRRLLDLGVVPRTMIEVAMRSPLGDPTCYRLRDTLLALRREQADLIEIEMGVES